MRRNNHEYTHVALIHAGIHAYDNSFHVSARILRDVCVHQMPGNSRTCNVRATVVAGRLLLADKRLRSIGNPRRYSQMVPARYTFDMTNLRRLDLFHSHVFTIVHTHTRTCNHTA